ncbi:hypothetical protein C0991_009646 [Blastosporella zonata]|nr:hypothetical protein C0991_009646 [Blastosporella zonata]
MSGTGPRLPRKIIFYILYITKDLPDLWINCRAVSRDFRRVVERIFQDRHMRRIMLIIDTGFETNPNGSRCHFVAEFNFAHFDPLDPNRVVFRDTECTSVESQALFLRVKMEHGNPLRCPNVFVKIRRFANDTAVPGLQFVFDELEASFEWKGLLQAFFKEEREVARRVQEWEDSSGPQTFIEETKGQLQRGEITQGLSDSELEHKALSVRLHYQKEVRRERISRDVLEKEGVEMVWANDDEPDETNYDGMSWDPEEDFPPWVNEEERQLFCICTYMLRHDDSCVTTEDESSGDDGMDDDP